MSNLQDKIPNLFSVQIKLFLHRILTAYIRHCVWWCHSWLAGRRKS